MIERTELRERVGYVALCQSTKAQNESDKKCKQRGQFRLTIDKLLLRLVRGHFNASAPESGLLRARKFNKILR